MSTITSRQNPIVSRYRAAARGEARDQMLIDGAHVLADALAACLPVLEAAVTTAAELTDQGRELLLALRRSAVEVTMVSAPVMDALSPVRTSSGFVALARRPAWDDSDVYATGTPLVAIAIDVQDPGNLGAIVRAAEAAGATGVVAAGAGADPFGWKALRGSMGSALRLPIVLSPTAEESIDGARRRGCRIVATAPRGGRPLFDAALAGPVAILIGGEGGGVEDRLLAAADDQITIPMQPPVESLNTAVAAALLLYEARRQRQRGDSQSG